MLGQSIPIPNAIVTKKKLFGQFFTNSTIVAEPLPYDLDETNKTIIWE